MTKFDMTDFRFMHPDGAGTFEFCPAFYKLNPPLIAQGDEPIGQFVDDSLHDTGRINIGSLLWIDSTLR